MKDCTNADRGCEQRDHITVTVSVQKYLLLRQAKT